jgi:outer membrane protein assembly factor BamA
MKERFASLVLLLSAVVCPDRVLGQSGAEAVAPRVGQIFITGITITRQDVILNAVQMYPGTVLRPADLTKAEKNLEQLGLFEIDRARGVRPTLSIVGEGHFKDILVTVQETRTSRLRVMSGVSVVGDGVISLVWEERNFDPLRWPTSLDDLKTGTAFRGAGQVFRLELLQVPVLPLRFPRFLQVGGRFIPVEFGVR